MTNAWLAVLIVACAAVQMGTIAGLTFVTYKVSVMVRENSERLAQMGTEMTANFARMGASLDRLAESLDRLAERLIRSNGREDVR